MKGAHPATAPGEIDGKIIPALCAWFRRHARDLPWRRVIPRTGRRDPYASLVSELMLQQTQVSRVVGKFGEFMRAFPTVEALAEASEHDVLALWSGLGYYRRARLLHACARAVVADHAGVVPGDAATLRTLPGVGRYTAGAIASMVFDRPEPLVDGNVSRVLLRIAGKDLPSPDAPAWAWSRAEGLLAGFRWAKCRTASPGEFNEAMMELGATVCTPDRPRCRSCPVRGLCRAAAKGTQDAIPRPKVSPERRGMHVACVVVRDSKGRVLMEQRPPDGLWAGLWQPPAMEGARPIPASTLAAGLELGGTTRLRRLGTFVRVLSHRRVRFVVYHAEQPVCGAPGGGGFIRRWFRERDIARLGLSNAHAQALGLAGVRLPGPHASRAPRGTISPC